MKENVANVEPQESEVLTKEFVSKIAKRIYSDFLKNKLDLDADNQLDLEDDNQEVAIEFTYSVYNEDESFGISINPDEIYIDEYEGDAYGWQDYTDSYDTLSITEQIENEVNKFLGTKHSHKKNKEVIKHMKDDMD